MSETVVDARGLACPQPVILTRKAMRTAQAVTTLVNGPDQVGNVRRLAEKAGWHVQVESRDDAYALILIQGDAQAQASVLAATAPVSVSSPQALVISGDRMGQGDDELGSILIRAFFHALTEAEAMPNTIVFYNSGVRLTIEGSPILDDLRALAERDVELLVCGTCLDYYGIKERIAVGVISNMYTILETLLEAGRVFSP